jgi:P27 family predicted phage terminase small subunit
LKIPKHLSQESRNFYRKVVQEFELEDHHLKILQAACETWDRVVEARIEVEKNGSFFVDRWNQSRENPAAKSERDQKVVFARLIRELNLDIAAPDSRPPSLY